MPRNSFRSADKATIFADRQLAWINYLYQRPDLAHLRPWLKKQARLVAGLPRSPKQIDGWDDDKKAPFAGYTAFREGSA